MEDHEVRNLRTELELNEMYLREARRDAQRNLKLAADAGEGESVDLLAQLIDNLDTKLKELEIWKNTHNLQTEEELEIARIRDVIRERLNTMFAEEEEKGGDGIRSDETPIDTEHTDEPADEPAEEANEAVEDNEDEERG